MAAPKRRDWNKLGTAQRKRYLSAGRKRGLTDAQIRQHYTSGGSLSEWRGHRKRAGISERQWTTLRQAALASKLDLDLEHHDVSVVLESLLAKGFSYAWILQRLQEKEESRRLFKTQAKRRARYNRPKDDEGYNPGRRRYHARNQIADIEIYWYN